MSYRKEYNPVTEVSNPDTVSYVLSPVTFPGGYYRVKDTEGWPPPVQQDRGEAGTVTTGQKTEQRPEG